MNIEVLSLFYLILILLSTHKTCQLNCMDSESPLMNPIDYFYASFRLK